MFPITKEDTCCILEYKGETMEKLKLVISEKEIRIKIEELAEAISQDYAGKKPVFIGVLKGAFIFLADLVRKVSLEGLEIDFVRLASYGLSDTTSGEVKIIKDIELDLENKDVLVIEDIIDTGITLDFFLKHLEKYKPNSVKVCCLIDKPQRREIEVPIHYRGFYIREGFLVGYGLDFAEKYRQLPEVYEIVKE
ncbi:hypoxanthine phosphoribosyltransferase [Thermodesulfatator indicus DSM 15286]|uniref:Hypoxanthine phosphoribosyltransferase n=1 Tax=Thermodesulfatator indicus (strain DSM 15286 / JCM 11887 / CIR29812) TaxID=667014 RepID=F8ABP9_THEID|nr:hypoxanthine phosphoribosyltransferase [Thermodesulfatator indicus]AEH44501.1 hypoxanthine phosphoribosyltransferase [Thermodesulfatator indicus DSM 15286]